MSRARQHVRHPTAAGGGASPGTAAVTRQPNATQTFTWRTGTPPSAEAGTHCRCCRWTI